MRIRTLFCLLPLTLAGCVGYNSTLFMTKSNFGLDADLKPPTLEISLARREAVISPTFDEGKTPPVAASFRIEPGAQVPFFPRISSTFSGGDAAGLMSDLYGDDDDLKATSDTSIPLAQKPVHRLLGLFPLRPQRPGDIQPFLFGTDTSIGLKAAWSGVSATFPDTVKFGFNRKEFALAPVVLTEAHSTNAVISVTTNGLATNAVPKTTYSVKMPSFLATLDNSISTSTITDTQVKHLQYFATGKAAENLARRQSVREAMVARLDPVAASLENIRKNQSVNTLSRQNATNIINAIADTDSTRLTNVVVAAFETELITAADKDKMLAAIPAEPARVKKYLNTVARAGSPVRGQKLQRFVEMISN